ncbi:phospholipase A2 inhibitor and Ly6/PLAUR domain-containing protein-like [Leptodactylus fuscus]|uniref:phospholipase A2 inhibitor and Ly6/PLAUR domain-containing protein-like n=1 Tax=Leptodactylus fuscus TaxID=238119 RepID=UPI003F4F2DD8
MISVFGILTFLSALTATSYALSCTECLSASSTCSGISVPCPTGYVCGSAYTETNTAGVKTEVLVRQCVPSKECNFKGSMGIPIGHIRMVTSCCYTDGCTPNLPASSPTSSNPNGLVCRSCISADSNWCYTSDTMQCTGDENMCLLQTTKTSGPISSSTAIRGCATKSICDLGSKSETVGGLSSSVKFICTSGGLSVHKVVLTPAIVCLLLLKFFF